MTDLTGQGIFDYIRKLEHQEELGVMEARHYPYQIGFETIVPYAASITEADLVMTDGRSLEQVGVLPHEMLVPSASDLAAGLDIVMARAVVLGVGK